MSKARDLANFGDDISDGVISAALDGDGSALTGLSAGATEVVSSGTASDVASIEFTNLDLTTYDYKIVLRGLKSHYSYGQLYLNASVDNLSTLRGFNYQDIDGSGAWTDQTVINATDITVHYNHSSFFELNVSFQPSSFSYSKNVMQSAWIGFDRTNAFKNKFKNYIEPPTNIDGAALNSIRLYMSSGNITANKYTLYRTVKS